jgi:hypothetical protein
MLDWFHHFFADFQSVVMESTDEILIYFLLVFLFVTIILVSFYVYNRRKYYKIFHKIPARLVRDHLNAIIDSSNALKSSLFEGEQRKGLTNLPELDMAKVSQAQKEDHTKASLAYEELKNEKEQLEKKLAKFQEVDSELKEIKEKFDNVIKERDDLSLLISDYKLLEDEFVNLKKLREENRQLKQELGISEEVKEESQNLERVQEEPSSTEVEGQEEKEKEDSTQTEEKQEEKEEKKEEEKAEKHSPQAELKEDPKDLLKEFEKMLD